MSSVTITFKQLNKTVQLLDCTANSFLLYHISHYDCHKLVSSLVALVLLKISILPFSWILCYFTLKSIIQCLTEYPCPMGVCIFSEENSTCLWLLLWHVMNPQTVFHLGFPVTPMCDKQFPWHITSCHFWWRHYIDCLMWIKYGVKDPKGTGNAFKRKHENQQSSNEKISKQVHRPETVNMYSQHIFRPTKQKRHSFNKTFST